MLGIRGGITRAGRRRPLAEPRKQAWVCRNGHRNKPSHTRCLTLGCNDRREHAVAA